MKKMLLFLLLIFFVGCASGQSSSFISDSLNQYIKKGLMDWNIPGLAIVIVKDGQQKQNEFVEYDPYTFIKVTPK